MFTFKCHGTYINDLKPPAQYLSTIAEEDVIQLLDYSPYAQRAPEPPGEHSQGTLLNKGYALVNVRHGCAIFVYNYDGKYALYTAEAEPALKALGLTLVPER